MAGEGGINGTAIAVVLGGSVLAYAAIKGKSISNVSRSLITGKNPSDVTQSSPIVGSSTTSSVVTNGVQGSTYVRDTVMNYAQAQLGKKYFWGAAGPDTFDCSGLTMMAYKQIGINLPHFSQAQAVMGQATSTPQVADIVYFGLPVHHVALWADNNQILEAYDARYPIRLAPMRTSERYGFRNIIG